MNPVALALILAAAPPAALDCIDAHGKRNQAAVRMRALLEREAERGHLNRAEIGAVRALILRRERLLVCRPETDL